MKNGKLLASTIKKQSQYYNEKIHFHMQYFSSCSPIITIGSVKPPELSIIYPDPTFNNLLVIQESVQDTLVKSTLKNRQN
jgi:hypothetical protein